MKAKIQITMTFDVFYPITEGETEHNDLNVQLADFYKEVADDPLDIVLEYTDIPKTISFEFCGTVEK